MIRLTRLGNSTPLYVNADHIERLDEHHDTLVRMTNGNEYVVTEKAGEIVELVVAHRARVLALSFRFAASDGAPDGAPDAGTESGG